MAFAIEMHPRNWSLSLLPILPFFDVAYFSEKKGLGKKNAISW